MTSAPARPVSGPVSHGTARLLPDVDRPRAWLLTVDDVPQSYVDLDDPGHLEFEYVRRLAQLLAVTAPAAEPQRVVHLGGGALSLPRHLVHARPGSRHLVVEDDGALIELVAATLGPPPPGIEVCRGDAVAVLSELPAASVDAVVADVFSGDRTPAHLTTPAFLRRSAAVLRPGGVHLANLADSAPFAFLRSQLAAAAEVFEEVCLVAEPSVLRGRRFGNAVLAAADRPLPVADLARRCAADAFPARVVHGPALRRFVGDARPPRGAGVPSPRLPEGAFTVG
ncbi:spermidine synthase [Streptomyces bohaiensis]|uniref:Fused MFS/spermidine synthase n=2 Tax=Streptomyces bohaiensis TaxID=1431344 RepID=A0ABX1CI08_9ACTN|nr:fused MFS/spermidine synthase [Streptomyces bohaiensis]NJQ16869.1 fused MFS/spermidine synthase [Streptomyces bohaiensis]